MQVAQVMIAVAGDAGNTVTKFGVTPSEVAVLLAIHGNDAVTNIKILGTVARRNRDELARIKMIYGGAVDENQKKVVETLFPGAAARVFENFKELELDESFFAEDSKSEAGVESADNDVLFNEPIVPLDAQTQAEIEAAVENDGIDDMDDAEQFQEPAPKPAPKPAENLFT